MLNQEIFEGHTKLICIQNFLLMNIMKLLMRGKCLAEDDLNVLNSMIESAEKTTIAELDNVK